jgi:hypothetical protein
VGQVTSGERALVHNLSEGGVLHSISLEDGTVHVVAESISWNSVLHPGGWLAAVQKTDGVWVVPIP